MLVMPMAPSIYRFGYLSCKPNAPGTYNLYCNKPFTAAASDAANGVHALAITRSNWICRSTAAPTTTASAETTAVAGRRGGEKQKQMVTSTYQREDDDWQSFLAPEKLELLRHMEPWVEDHILPLLKPVEASWQPSDLLPDPATLGSDGFHDACLELRAAAAGVPDDLLVCLVANMVTEEALPTYPSVLNRVAGVRDATGADASPWARWIRGWSAEENRHGDVLNRYMHLSGRFDMREVERTVQRLIRDGMAVHAPASPFHAFVYVAFQERATAIAHGRTAALVRTAGGDAALARVCGTVAADEKRHEAAYTRVMRRVFEADPDAAVRAMAYMMRRRIDMPTAFITDGNHCGGGGSGEFYGRFIAIAEKAGTYTVSDYRGILEHLLREWGVQELAAGLSGEGRRARDYLCALPSRIRRMEEMAHDRAKNKAATPVPISWIFDRTISVVLP